MQALDRINRQLFDKSYGIKNLYSENLLSKENQMILNSSKQPDVLMLHSKVQAIFI